MSPKHWSISLCALLAVHIAWGLLRVPTKVVLRRLDDVATYRRVGDAAFLLGDPRQRGAEAILWLRANTAPDAVVLWAGDVQGSLEFAPALLWPRLLVDAGRCAEAATYAGRPIATAVQEGRTGRVVLVGTKDDLRVEVR